MSETFCILPWIHAQTKPNGQIKPCCRFDHHHEAYKTKDGFIWDEMNINKGKSLTDAVLSDQWEDIRNKMLAGEKVEGCWKCYKEEKNNYDTTRSMRVGSNTFWNKKVYNKPKHNKGELKFLELALGNYCNLQCRTCNSDLSSSWTEDENTLSDYYTDRTRRKTVTHVDSHPAKQDFQYVEEIKFTGGEPMLHPRFIEILDIILETNRSQHITLDIFTNASWVPKKKILDRLQKFKKVKINLSIDGLDKTNDYIRYPSTWGTVEQSTKKWLTQDTDVFSIKWTPTINLYNVLEVTEMIDWWTDIQIAVKQKPYWESVSSMVERYDRNYRAMNMIINLVHTPSYLSVNNLPFKKDIIQKVTAQKEKYIDQLKTFDGTGYDRFALTQHIKSMFNKILVSLEQNCNIDDLKLFKSYTADLDILRKQNFESSLPMLKEQFADKFIGKVNV